MIPAPPYKPKVVPVLYRRIPKHLHDTFKAWCAARGIHMQDKIIELMRDCVKPPKGSTLMNVPEELR